MSKKNALERGFSSENFWQRRKKIVYSAIAAILILSAVFFLLPTKPQKQALMQTVIPLSWLKQYFNSDSLTNVSVVGANADPDHDGLTNLQEYLFHTNPMVADTDRDGISDGQEVAAGTDPNNPNDPSTATTAQAKPLPVDNFVEEVKNQLAAEGLSSEQDVNDFLNLNREVVLPSIPDAQIKIVPDSASSVQDYQLSSSKIINEFSSGGIDSLVGQVFNADSLADAKALSSEFDSILSRLDALQVPKSSVATHKTALIFFGALKKIADSKLAMLQNPGDLSGWGEIVYQLKILSIVGGENANFSEADLSSSGP